jgi:hypothetical protein
MSMKLIIGALLTSTVAAASPPADPLDQPGFEAPAAPWTSVEQAERDRRCRDRIEQARSEAGRPKLEREPASPDKPLLIYAVDHRVDGCGVLVPVGDPADIRQSPPPGPPAVIPAG